jgi:hypothetical protein
MKKTFLIAIAISSLQTAMAQFDLPPSGGNARAKITEEVGITDITIKYSRPDVNKREGKMWGDGNVVTYGFTTTNLTTNKNTNPWRAGANENTTITFEHDVKVEGRDVKAGTYGLFFALWPDSATLILSSKSTAWGSFYYDPKDDVLRATIKPVALDKSVEWLKYEFIQQGEKSCTIAMMWEKLMLPFRVDVDVDKIVIARLREQVESQAGFNNLNLVAAAQFCLNKNINHDEALAWSQRAAGLKSYTTLRTLATAYEKLNRIPLADSTMGEAVAIATVNQHVAYGRTLITQKRPDKALEVLLAAQKKYGDVYAVNNGLMFGYSSKTDYKKAIAAGEKALAQAPNDIAKKSIDASLVKLKEGKDIN